MLVRAFRLTDKFSNAFLKLTIYLATVLLERILGLRQALEVTVSALVMTGASVVTGLSVGAYNFVTRRGETAVRAAEDRRRRLNQLMVQRATDNQRALVDAGGKVIEDPMLARNRTLSAMIVVLLIALIFFLFQSSNDGGGLGFSNSGLVIATNPPFVGNASVTPAIPAPSPTPLQGNLPSNITGALVFTVRQNGQEDVWALPVGSAQPIRLTDSLEDDRNPAWSPDASKVAFSSRRDGTWDLYILDLLSGQTTRLTDSPDYEGYPTWSPDGAFLAYEGYNAETGNIDIFLVSTDGQQGVIQVTTSPFPDLEPAWSPEGREIAYVAWRNGSHDIMLLDLNNPSEGSAINLTNSADIHEHRPRWSPDGTRIAYQANADGVQGIYIKNAREGGDARLVGRGQSPTWNPLDGSSLFYAVPQERNSAIYLGQVDAFGVGANAIAFEGLVSDLDWAQADITYPGFALQTPALYQEAVERREGKVDLRLLSGVDAPYPMLSDSVNDSFEAMRQRVRQTVGIDLLSDLEDAYWRIDSQNGPPRLPEPGQERTNWHYTGRAIALDRTLALLGDPPILVVVREETELGTMWRVFARVAENAQNGALGEPLRTLPWDFNTRSQDPVAFEEGGSLMDSTPPGYYVDLTELFNDFGWERLRADRTWRTNFSGVLYWVFVKDEGLAWQDAMQQIYTPDEFNAFLTGITPLPPTPIPSATPQGENSPQNGDEPTEEPTGVDEVG